MLLRCFTAALMCWLSVVACGSAVAQTAAASPQASASAAEDRHPRTVYEVRVSHSHARRRAACSPPSMCPRTPSRNIRFSCGGLLIAASPTASISIADKIGPSDQLAKSGYIYAFQDVRGRWMSEGELENMRPQIACQAWPARHR